jgi:hypothetical protein
MPAITERENMLVLNALHAHHAKNQARYAKNRKYYCNPFALDQYIVAFGEMKEEMERFGKTIAQGIYDSFQGALLTDLEKALSLPVTKKEQGAKKGELPRPTY